MLEISSIYSGYGKVIAIQGVDLQVERGQIVSLIGTNGSGKSTIIKNILGIQSITKGSIYFDGNKISCLTPNKIVRKGISLVPEGRQIFPELTVEENLRVGAYCKKNKRHLNGEYEKIYCIFNILKEKRNHPGGSLSGGQQQMLAIGRALMSDPKLLLMDEPSLGLAPLVVKEIFKVVKNINKKGVAVLIVEQNVKMAFSVAEHGFVLDSGKIVFKRKMQCVSKQLLC